MTDVLTPDALPAALRAAISSGIDRTMCPRCDGGASRETSLSIRQDDGILRFRCYRASCGWYGMTIAGDDVRFVAKQLKPANVYRDPILPLGPYLTEKLSHYRVALDLAKAHGWGQNERGDTLIMPIRSRYGEQRGIITRTFDKPKRCYTFKATAQPWQDWWPRADNHGIVIVEDCISALRLHGLGYTAVALLGTSMSVAQAKELRSYPTGKPVWLALDRDAFHKAITMTWRHAHILQMQPVCIEQDIKNMPDDNAIRRLFHV